MSALLEIALTNAALALPLAALAWAGSLFRRPAVTHALWLLVLLRLVMPPVWHVPVGTAPIATTTTDPMPEPPSTATPDFVVSAPTNDAPLVVPPILVLEEADEPAGPTELAAVVSPWPWETIATGIWLAGTGLCLTVAAGRIVLFRRVLRYARPAAGLADD